MTNSLLPSFKLWLQARNYQPTTVKNYVADTNNYLRYAVGQNHFSSSVLSAYITQISSKNNAKRYLASLSKFCQFAFDQHLISQNPFKKSLRFSQKNIVSSPSQEIDALLTQFQQHLSHQKRSPSTIRNYINDLHQYIKWTNTP